MTEINSLIPNPTETPIAEPQEISRGFLESQPKKLQYVDRFMDQRMPNRWLLAG